MSVTVNQSGFFKAGRVRASTQRRPFRLPDLGTALTILAAGLLIAGFCIAAKPLVMNDLPLLIGNGTNAAFVTK